MSFIQPMFHLKLKPRPPWSTGWVTLGQEVDSSATMSTSGWAEKTAVFSFCRKSTASRFS